MPTATCVFSFGVRRRHIVAPRAWCCSLIGQFGGLSDTIIRRYTQQVVSALADLHACGIVHGGLSIDHILVTSTGSTTGCVKLSGLGATWKMREGCKRTTRCVSVSLRVPDAVGGRRRRSVCGRRRLTTCRVDVLCCSMRRPPRAARCSEPPSCRDVAPVTDLCHRPGAMCGTSACSY